MKVFVRHKHAERGATAVEYALVIGLVSLIIVGAAVNLGGVFAIWAGALVDTVDGLLNG
ncbi:Flp family type IVb pilin [Aeromicrobium sp.]|uniref:Flp family type IVb pilin n=1 Tax=Aeromicrobium sp. TaxID=1871063 RepID=UPI002FC9DFAA